jgi:flavoprotein
MNNNSPLKARMFVGGLKSLFIDMAETLDEVEKTGSMPVDILQSLMDIKSAIDMTLIQLSRASVRCCEHAPECPHTEGDEEDDEQELMCEGCDESLEECECEEEEEEEEEPPPPPPPPPVKKQKNKVVIPSKKATKH